LLGALFFCNFINAAEYKVGVRAHYGIAHAKVQWQATTDYLSAKIPEHTFKLVPIIMLGEISEMTGRGELDFILTNPSSYIEIEMQHGARALVTLNYRQRDKGRTIFGSVIFTLAEREDIIVLDDLRGKSLMAVSEVAFGGWRVAWLEMLDNGIDPYNDLKEVRYAISEIQDDVVYAVRDGKVDVGVVRTDQLERLANRGAIDLRYFRVLNNKDTPGFPFFHSTALYPEWVFAAKTDLSEELVNQVRGALLVVAADSLMSEAGNYMAWVPALNYQPVKALMQRLRVGPFVDKGKLEPVDNITIIGLFVIAGILVFVFYSILRSARSREQNHSGS